ncbi:MAG: hypothetical protein LDL13_08635 [Calditerrivibrio sp.]|nr:hypothetical protein [Calditerrivibrio sp.]
MKKWSMIWINKSVYLFVVVYILSTVFAIYLIYQGLYQKRGANLFSSSIDGFVDIAIKSEGNYLRHLSLITPQSVFPYGFDYQPFQTDSLIYKRGILYQNYPFILKIR